MRFVLDASAAVDALLPGTRRDTVREHLRNGALVAPALVDSEVLSALARLERAGAISTAEADRAVDDWRRLPCERVPTPPLLPMIWTMRTALRVADAHYVALARVVGATLLTSDGRLARAQLKGVAVLLVS